MNILIWIIFGIIAGITMEKIAKRNEGGIRASIVLGILGALIGGLLLNVLFGIGVVELNSQSIMVAIFGSLALLFFAQFTRG